MSIIKNPRQYDSKLPTNVRIDEKLKEHVYAEAEKRSVPIARIINEALEDRYKENEKG